MEAKVNINEDCSTGLGTIKLNRPQSLNALDNDMYGEIQSVIDRWQNHPKMRAILMIGAGDRAFSAGGDVKGLRSLLRHPDFPPEVHGKGIPGVPTADAYRVSFTLIYRLACMQPRLPQISLWNGVVMGGGVGLSLYGRFRVATESTVWAMPETRIGLIPDCGTTMVFARLPWGLGPYLALTGRSLGAAELVRWGLATHVVPVAQLPALRRRLGVALQAQKDTPAHVVLEGVLNWFHLRYGHEVLAFSRCSLEEHLLAIDRCFGNSKSLTEIFNRLAAEKTPWAQETCDHLQELSPTALEVALQLVLAAAAPPGDTTPRGSAGPPRRTLRGGGGAARLLPAPAPALARALRLEFRAQQRLQVFGDFAEGVRAQLLERGGGKRKAEGGRGGEEGGAGERRPRWRQRQFSAEGRGAGGWLAPLGEEGELRLRRSDWGPGEMGFGCGGRALVRSAL